jgi:hypothetical protein
LQVLGQLFKKFAVHDVRVQGNKIQASTLEKRKSQFKTIYRTIQHEFKQRSSTAALDSANG